MHLLAVSISQSGNCGSFMQLHPSYQQQSWIILVQNADPVLVYALVISKLAISSMLLYYAMLSPRD